MTIEINDKLIGVIGTITGTILGFFLSEWRQWRTEDIRFN